MGRRRLQGGICIPRRHGRGPVPVGHRHGRHPAPSRCPGVRTQPCNQYRGRRHRGVCIHRSRSGTGPARLLGHRRLFRQSEPTEIIGYPAAHPSLGHGAVDRRATRRTGLVGSRRDHRPTDLLQLLPNVRRQAGGVRRRTGVCALANSFPRHQAIQGNPAACPSGTERAIPGSGRCRN
ncbi:Uncharacterised protein [Mycobacteroides abscessus subsp. abscessus]|nr:Uncharacterised protein [Mycobacteroides abscessus subsp. abscessus]